MVSQTPMTITSQRPVRLSAQQSSAGRPATPAFVSDLASRYLDRGTARAGIDFVWQRAQHVYAPINQLRYAPHISLAFSSSQHLEIGRPAQALPSTTRLITHERRTTEQPLTFTLLQPHTHEAVTSVIERVVSRTVRRNATDPQRVLPSPPAVVLPNYHRPRPESNAIAELPVRRLARQQTSTPAERTGADSLVTAEARPRQLRREPASHHSMASEIDINDLTERVVRSIDRRVIAQRERFGRG